MNSDELQSRTGHDYELPYVLKVLAGFIGMYLQWRAKDCPVCEEQMTKLTAPYGWTCMNTSCRAYRCNYPAARLENNGIRTKETYER